MITKEFRYDVLEIINPKIDESIEKRIQHMQPSEPTLKKFDEIKKEVNFIKDKFYDMGKTSGIIITELKSIKEHISRDVAWKEKFENKIEKEYSKKWVENFMSKMAYIFIGLFCTLSFTAIIWAISQYSLNK